MGNEVGGSEVKVYIFAVTSVVRPPYLHLVVCADGDFELCESFTSCVSSCLYFDHPGQEGLGNRTLYVWGSAGQCVGGIDEFDSSTSLIKCEHGHRESVNSSESCVKPAWRPHKYVGVVSCCPRSIKRSGVDKINRKMM